MEFKHNNLDDKCIIVFSGFNQRAVIAFLRTLKKNDLNFAIIAKSGEDDIFLTDYKCKVFSIRHSVLLIKDDLIRSIKEIQRKKKADQYIIAPTTEALIRFLLQYKSDFETLKCEVPLVYKDLYELISNKYSFGSLCTNYNIMIPEEINIEKGLQLPLVAKPKAYFSSSSNEPLSPIIISSLSHLRIFLKDYKKNDYYFQEFISGKSIYLLYYFHRDGTIFKYSQENLIQQPNGKSMVAAISSSYHDTAESYKYEKLFRDLGFFGLVMIEIKCQLNQYYMIEANPRFWGPSQLFIDAGMNFFEAFLHDFGLIKDKPKFDNLVRKKTRYFWHGGIVEVFKKHEELEYHTSDETMLFNMLPKWLENDVYRRKDTYHIFKKELLS